MNGKSSHPLAPPAARRRGILLVVGTVLLGTSVGVWCLPARSPVLAADTTFGTLPKTTAPAFPGIDTRFTALWALLLLLSVCAVIAVMVARKARAARDGNGTIHLVDTLLLGGRRMLHLVRVDNRKYLISNSERGIQFLASVPENEVEAEVEELARQAEGEAPFSAYLNLGGRLR